MTKDKFDEIRTVKHVVKNNVFISLFTDVENVYKLYKELHPEATNVKVSDIKIHSMESIFINDIYNDLGFLVNEGSRTRCIILIEAQSKWTDNMTLRMLLYLAETYRHYLSEMKISVHTEKRIDLPKPELYVVYTGNKEVEDEISFKDSYFNGDCAVDVKVKILKQPSKETVSGQYIGFSKVYDEQRYIYKNKIKCIKETIRICKETGYLVEFLTEHESEVITMLSYLFDEQAERETYRITRDREKFEEGIAEGRKEGIAEGRKEGIAEGRKEGIAEGRKEGIAEGIAEGKVKGIVETLVGLVKKQLISVTDAAQEAHMSVSEFEALLGMKEI